MSFTSLNNKFLKVGSNVILTPIIDAVITKLDSYFEKCPATVTSGLRDAERQLKVIGSYLKSKGLISKYPDFDKWKPTDLDPNNKGQYIWQVAWSNLLNIGLIINPPLQAKCLSDYYRNGKNLKGTIINQTPHARGTAFNIGGSSNGPSDEAQCLEKAVIEKVPGLVSYLLERENNAIHVNCRKI